MDYLTSGKSGALFKINWKFYQKCLLNSCLFSIHRNYVNWLINLPSFSKYSLRLTRNDLLNPQIPSNLSRKIQSKIPSDHEKWRLENEALIQTVNNHNKFNIFKWHLFYKWIIVWLVSTSVLNIKTSFNLGGWK